MSETVKLKRGDKVITRTKTDYEVNKTNWEHRGFTIMEAWTSRDIPQKRKTKKKNKK